MQCATTLDELQEEITHLRDLYGVDHIVYHWVGAEGDQYGCGTYTREWAAHYVASDYLRVDPVITGCFQSFHPVDWRALDWSSKGARAFAEDARAHGVGHQGFSVPIRGPSGQFALFTVSDGRDDAAWDAFTADHRSDLILLAHYFNGKALEFEQSRIPAAPKPLSPRETDVMTYLALGYNRARVAEILAISEHTLRAYIEGARSKLGAINTTHAVARAMTEGIIVVPPAPPREPR